MGDRGLREYRQVCASGEPHQVIDQLGNRLVVRWHELGTPSSASNRATSADAASLTARTVEGKLSGRSAISGTIAAR
jgi:hypothetical protein